MDGKDENRIRVGRRRLGDRPHQSFERRGSTLPSVQREQNAFFEGRELIARAAQTGRVPTSTGW